MLDKQSLNQLINDLSQKGVLDSVEKEDFLKLLESNETETAKTQLYAALQEKLMDTDTEIIGTSLNYAAAVREVAEKSGDEELLKLADELDNSIKDSFEVFNEEMDTVNEEHQELSPLLNEIEKEAEKAE